MPKKCKNNPNSFCYICGEYTLPGKKSKLNKTIGASYKSYFGCEIGDQDKAWAPHICCLTCTANLNSWSKIIISFNNYIKYLIAELWCKKLSPFQYLL